MAFTQSFDPPESSPSNNRITGVRYGNYLSRIMLIVLLTLIIAVASGFAVFNAQVRQVSNAVLPVRADAIVVLTGAAGRLETAYELLDQKRANRLLISGVHPDTSQAAILNAIGRDSINTNCCVDLDHAALDTIGNARETKIWADKFNFDKLIVVTSDYHLPRSILEIQSEMPDAQLFPYPAHKISNALSNGNPTELQLKLREYAKWVASIFRINTARLLS